jgi:Flp pilus assembly protein TadD
LRLIEPASRVLTDHAESQFHAAVIYAAVGRLDEAGRALRTAGQLDPSLKERAEYRDLQRKLKR